MARYRTLSMSLAYTLPVTDSNARYPTHVWSPSGGWYAQPANWKANTLVVGACIVGIVAFTWNLSAQLEERPRMPEKGRFFPSR